ncbi:MAG: alpha amylase N-terminal ig-like domain-containing protein [Pseudobutyrivibrio sp.]|nr:alpha amylase N-terminal ig-like domain-containing protein [Pseudobutyrivibrio sp.]
MKNWKNSIYSDGSKYFVSNPQPTYGETVTIKLRLYEDAPVVSVFMRSLPNGAENVVKMDLCDNKNGFNYYQAKMLISESRMQYQFYIACADKIYYYTQRGLTDYIQDNSCDFVLLADYRQPSWVKSQVFYQIFPARFKKSDKNEIGIHEGDLLGIKEKIPYLKYLGVTAIYLNPIFMAPSDHKYDCSDYFHVDDNFGGDQALAELSDALHQAGMKLMLDISINHTGSTNRWTVTHPDYYFRDEQTGKFYGWAGYDSLPTLDYRNHELRRVIYENNDSVIKKWLKPPYSIDGWRFDVADVFARKDEVQLAHDIWPKLRASIRSENDDAYILAEDWGDCAQYQQGTEWDSSMNYFGCARPLREFAGEVDLFIARNEELKSIHPYITGENVAGRIREHLSRIPFAMWQNQFNLIDSHDISRLHNNPEVNPGDYKGTVITQYMLIGTPSLYYGDELDIQGHLLNDSGCRYPMPWDREDNKPDIFYFYKTLNKLKTSTPALIEGGMEIIYAQGPVIALARFSDEEAYVSVFSKSDKSETIELEIGLCGFLNIPEDKDIFGNVLSYTRVDEATISMTLNPHTAYLFKVN